MNIPQWVKDYIVPLILGIVASAIVGYFSYGFGYDDGFEVGREDAITAYIAEREEEFRQMRESLKEELDKEETAFKQQLKDRKEEFDKNLDRIAAERSRQKIQAVRSECDKQIADLKDLGYLWREYRNRVAAWRADNPQTEQDMRATATAIVSIASAGRKAAMEMAEQLNGLVDDISQALERGDLERVKELIFALEQTLPAKEVLWQRHFGFIVAGQRTS